MENQKKYDVTALGELLIDFTPAGTSAQGSPILEQCPGHAGKIQKDHRIHWQDWK